MTDADSLRRAVEGADAVVHLVAIIKGKPADFERVMETARATCSAAAKEAGVRRFVLMSALGTSEANRDLVPYFRAKWAMEQAVAGSGLESVVFRPSFVFGADGGVLPMFVRQVRWSPVTPIVGSGEAAPAADLGRRRRRRSSRRRSTAGQAAGRTFELGGPDALTWNDLYARDPQRVLGTRRGNGPPAGLRHARGRGAHRAPPGAPITRDQLTMLTKGGDHVCDIRPGARDFRGRADRRRRADPPRELEPRRTTILAPCSITT